MYSLVDDFSHLHEKYLVESTDAAEEGRATQGTTDGASRPVEPSPAPVPAFRSDADGPAPAHG